MKILINESFYGFRLSSAAVHLLNELGVNARPNDPGCYRSDPRLIQVAERLGSRVSGEQSKLSLVEIPDGVEWHIHYYNNWETIHQDHRAWNGTGELDKCV